MVDGQGSMVNGRRRDALEQIRQVEQMPVFSLFYELALGVEKATRDAGRDFRWLRIQCLRSSESVCANMTEGFYSQYSTEYLQALYRCRREAHETRLHIKYAIDTGQISDSEGKRLLKDYEKAVAQLGGLIGSIERKITDYEKAKSQPGLVREDLGEYGLPSTIDHGPLTIDG